jgi:hypothetical protein
MFGAKATLVNSIRLIELKVVNLWILQIFRSQEVELLHLLR